MITEQKQHKSTFDKNEMLKFGVSETGETVLKLTDRRRGERVREEFTFEEIKRALDNAGTNGKTVV